MTHDGGPRTAPTASRVDAGTWTRSALLIGDEDPPATRRLRLLPLFLLPFLALATWWGISHIEHQVESTAPALLRDAGIDPAGLTFAASYRDLEVGGVLPPGIDAGQIAQALDTSSDDVDIRTVSVVAAADSDPSVEPVPTSTAPGATDELAAPASTPGSTTQGASSGANSGELEPTPPLTAVYDGETIVLQGTVATAAQADELQASAAAVVGPDQVRNELVVSSSATATPAASDRVTAFADTVATFDNLTRAEATLSATNLDVTGTAASRRARRPTQAALADARALGLDTETELQVEAAASMTLAEETEALGAELRGLQAEAAETIVFTSSSISLGPDARATLDKVVDAMRRYPQPVVEVGGHTDTDGSEPFNELLSQTRADAVAAYLIAKGIPTDRLVAVGYGESRLLVDDSTEPGKRQNRRVEFVAKEAF